MLAFCSALTYATLLLRSKKILRGISGIGAHGRRVHGRKRAPAAVRGWCCTRAAEAPTTPGAVCARSLTLGLVHTALAGIIFLGGLRRVRTDHAAILTYAEPVSAVVFAAAFLGEPLTAWTAIGGAMVVAGGLVGRTARPPRAEPAPPLEVAGTESETSERRLRRRSSGTIAL